MKSAYELAMERLQKAAPTKTLSEDQKRQIAEIDEAFKAKIAEREVFLQDQIAKAMKGGSSDEAADLQKQLDGRMFAGCARTARKRKKSCARVLVDRAAPLERKHQIPSTKEVQSSN